MLTRNNQFVIWWFLISLIGYIAAGFLTHFPSGTNAQTSWNLDEAGGGLAAGTIGGILIGGLQWIALKIGGYNFGGRWMLAAVVGFALTHFVGDIRPISVHFSWLGIFCGTLIGALFGLVQRRKGNVIYWMIIGAVTTYVAFYISDYVADAVIPPGWTPGSGQKRHTIYGFIIGLIQSSVMLYLLKLPLSKKTMAFRGFDYRKR
ncbi:hypothetical protein [Gorillibacterium massiliense]|uniref:hypothetical protein n=1 Tax=Gorillibacterium massiliense TaxID=1280390 RepID=UPI0005926D70|nr:hypothetical protein [Gorillibacterium massiliense]